VPARKAFFKAFFVEEPVSFDTPNTANAIVNGSIILFS
jgi:hypothetical protein